MQQGNAFRIKLPGTVSLKPHELHKWRARHRACQVAFSASEAIQVLFRQIDSAHRVIFRDITKNVRQLKCCSELYRKLQRFTIPKSKNVDATKSDGSRDAIAVALQQIKGPVRHDAKIHLRTRHQIVK